MRLGGVTISIFILSGAGAVAEPVTLPKPLIQCLACHGQTSPAAGFQILDSVENLRAGGYVVPGKTDESLVYQRVSSGTMPPAPMKTLSADEVRDVKNWIQSLVSTSSSPSQAPSTTPSQGASALSDEDARTSILKYVRENSDRSDAVFISYVDLIRSGRSKEEIALAQQAVLKAINSVSLKPSLVVPKRVEPSGQIWVFNGNDLGWDDHALYQVSKDINFNGPTGLAGRLAKLDSKNESSDRLERTFNAEHLVVALTNPDTYLELLRPEFSRARPSFFQFILDLFGDFPPDVESAEIAAGYRKSGVSSSQRIVYRSEFPRGYFWGSADFLPNTGTRDVVLFPREFGDAGEFIVALPNGMQMYAVADIKGTMITKADRRIVFDPKRRDGLVRSPTSCFSCHGNIGIIPRAASESVVGPSYQPRLASDAMKSDATRYQKALKDLGAWRGDSVEPITEVRKWVEPESYVK